MSRGVKTSEFWVAIVAAVLPILNSTFGLGIPEESFYALIAYILGRCGVKAVASTGVKVVCS